LDEPGRVAGDLIEANLFFWDAPSVWMTVEAKEDSVSAVLTSSLGAFIFMGFSDKNLEFAPNGSLGP